MMAPRVTLTSTKPWRKTSLDLTSNPLHGAVRNGEFVLHRKAQLHTIYQRPSRKRASISPAIVSADLLPRQQLID
jgi:hypothetical protein